MGENSLMFGRRQRRVNSLLNPLAGQIMRDSAPVGSVGAPGGLPINPLSPSGRDPVQNVLDASSMAPVIGDIMGPIADIRRFQAHPESRTIGNAMMFGLGVLPAIPSLVYLMSRGGDTVSDLARLKRQAGALGYPKTPSQVSRMSGRFAKILDDAGVKYTADKSRVSPSEYFYVNLPDGTDAKIRISQHADVHGTKAWGGYSVAPDDGDFDGALNFLRGHGVEVKNRVAPSNARILQNLLNHPNPSEKTRIAEAVKKAQPGKPALRAISDFQIEVHEALKNGATNESLKALKAKYGLAAQKALVPPGQRGAIGYHGSPHKFAPTAKNPIGIKIINRE